MNIERKLSYTDKCFNKDRIIFESKMINLDHWQCCHNCVNMNHATNMCSLFKAVPPISVAVVGCDNWQYEIPF